MKKNITLLITLFALLGYAENMLAGNKNKKGATNVTTNTSQIEYDDVAMALQTAFKCDYKENIEKFFNYNGDNKKYYYEALTQNAGYSIFDYIGNKTNIELVDYFLDRGVNPNHITSKGMNGLMFAANENNFPVFKHLLRSGANPYIEGNDETGVIDYISEDDQEMKNFIILVQEKLDEFVANPSTAFNNDPEEDKKTFISKQMFLAMILNNTDDIKNFYYEGESSLNQVLNHSDFIAKLLYKANLNKTLCPYTKDMLRKYGIEWTGYMFEIKNNLGKYKTLSDCKINYIKN